MLSRPALRDLGGMARHIARDAPEAALRMGSELLALAESLAVLPRRGGELRTRPGVRRLVREPCLVTHRIGEPHRVVYVLRFWQVRRDPQSWRTD